MNKPGASDIVFFVEFISCDDPAIADRWFDLLTVANRHKVTFYTA